ncbi:TPA: hypothetical protein P2Q98_001006 [Aeromonas veronii]|uniref:hypothetical protein n=1 Tax=Aeromonas veronii TaxID=654 RepID=UPI0033107760|nr:hypothetical protein [Aeromonas veronii]HDO1332875.1 hypothetical protein [Aeromonas veronii]HDO1337916.1 hypothetical protein [Aeromonas veronii]HDO1341947.1 hypothetical protein [Aeromonas veronii]HDO1347631.1 hypothetical protein [Aeromonas veronii]
MSQPPFKASQRRLLIGSAIALALFANPFSYDFAHNEWQMNQAYAKSCFIAGTRITMADGSTRPIETLRVGERVLDQHGGSNRILAIERVILGKRRLYGINDLPPFFTAEHPLLTTRGWAAISPAMTRTENPQLAVLPLFTGMQIMCRPAPAIVTGNLALQPQPELLLVESLCWIEASPTTALFNLLLDGSHSYIANELIVHNKDGDGGSGGSSSGGSNSGGGSNSSGGSDSDGGSDDSGGQGEHAGGEQHGGGERHAGGEKHAGGERHGGGRGFGNGVDDNGVDTVDANGNKLRGDGTVDDNGVDAVDANGNKLRGDGTIDDNGVDAVDANDNKLRGDGTVDDNGVDAVDANGNKLRGDGTVDDRQQVLTDEQERALLNNGFRQQGQP